MSNTISPNMNLIIPGVGTEAGPTYAQDVNNSLTLIDSHNHSPGSGVQITPNGLNINADLLINSNNITLARTVRFVNQSSPFTPAATDIGAVLEVGGDFYYINSAGVQVQITSGSSIVGTAGSITGLPSGTASASFASGTFVWQSATSTAANMDARSYIFRNNVANSKGLTLSPPNSMVADFALALPNIPASVSFMTLDTSGNMAAPTVYPLTNSGIADNTITKIKLAPFSGGVGGNINSAGLANAGSFLDVPSSVTTGLVIVGRPVDIRLLPLPTTSTSFLTIAQNNSTTGNLSYQLQLVANDGTTDTILGEFGIGSGISVFNTITQGVGSISSQGINTGTMAVNSGITAGANSGINTTSRPAAGTLSIPVTSISTIAIGLPAGTYTFRLRYGFASANTTLDIQNCRLLAYEIS